VSVPSLRVVVVATGVVLVGAPWVARAVVASRRDPGGTWLGAGALAATVRIEAGAPVALGLAIVVLEPRSTWLVLVPAVTATQWASVRASSWAVGVGPGTVLRVLAGRQRDPGVVDRRGPGALSR